MTAAQTSVDIPALKARHPLGDVVEALGVSLRGRGRVRQGLCPFHEEREGSFTVYADSQRWYCFGCGLGGDVLDFIQRLDELSLSEAIRRLGLAGTLTGLIVITLTITIPFVTWMMIGYFRNLPAVERLARTDGFSRIETFVKIILPLGRSGVAAAAVIAFLFAWNEYTYALMLVNGTPANTLPTAISGFLFQHPEPSHLAASLALTIVPPALVAFFLQRHIADMNLVDPVR